MKYKIIKTAEDRYYPQVEGPTGHYCYLNRDKYTYNVSLSNGGQASAEYGYTQDSAMDLIYRYQRDLDVVVDEGEL
jgi:hypothetical protein